MFSSSDSSLITVSSLISDFGYTVPHGKGAYTQSPSSLSRCGRVNWPARQLTRSQELCLGCSVMYQNLWTTSRPFTLPQVVTETGGLFLVFRSLFTAQIRVGVHFHFDAKWSISDLIIVDHNNQLINIQDPSMDSSSFVKYDRARQSLSLSQLDQESTEPSKLRTYHLTTWDYSWYYCCVTVCSSRLLNFRS
jgi:hypothetical protein